jgi:hypothetical protein
VEDVLGRDWQVVDVELVAQGDDVVDLDALGALRSCLSETLLEDPEGTDDGGLLPPTEN